MPLKGRSLKLGLAKTHLNDISSRTAFFKFLYFHVNDLSGAKLQKAPSLAE